MAPSVELLVAARAVQGLGAAVVAPLSLTILTAAFPAQRRGAIVGIWGGIAGLAIASGPLVGGAVTQGLDWHWIFWVNVPIGLVAAILSVLRLPESYGPSTRLDLPGVGLVSAGAIAIVWALVQANDLGWANPEIASTGSAGILLIAGFLAWERRAQQPMLPLRLFRNPAFTAANAAGFLMTGSLMAGAFLISQYLQFVLGYSPLNAGLRFLPMTATPLLVAPVAGALSDRIGRRPVMVVGLLLMAAGLGLFALVGTVAVGYGQLILPLVVAGVGASMVFAAAPAATLSAVAPPDMGKASGTANTLQRFGGVFGIALATAVFAANGHLGSPALFDAGFRPALAVAAVISALGAITALGVTTQRAHKAAPQQAEPSAATVAHA